MLPCQSLPRYLVHPEELSNIMNTTARSRRLGRTELKQKRRTSRKLSHQLSVDNDILAAGVDLHERVKQDEGLIRTCTYMNRTFPLSFKGEELLHWMVTHCWASHAVEAVSIVQILLNHNAIVNVSDCRNLMTFKKCALYRFREDQDSVPVEHCNSDNLDVTLDMLYRRLWSDWVIRSRVIGWWLYTNTLTGREFITWLTSTELSSSSREDAVHFANQLISVNFFIRIYPPVGEEKCSEFTDDDTIYQINVCCNQTVDTTTKVVHSLAHAVRLCSVESEECMFYGKSKIEDEMVLQQFEMEEDSPAASLKGGSEVDSLSEDAKKFLQSVSRAYYPEFTTAIEDTYYSYEADPENCYKGPVSIPDEMFHSFHMSTFEQDDSLVIELENGVDLRDMSERRGSEDPTSELYKERANTLDLIDTPTDRSHLFENARLQINFKEIIEEETDGL